MTSLLSHEESIELGLLIPTNSLEVWATVLLAAAQWKQERLERRGISAAFLKEIETLIKAVRVSENALGKEKILLPPEAALAQSIREAATAYREEASQILTNESGTHPEAEGNSRLGLPTGPLLGNLYREMECIVALLVDCSQQDGGRGVSEAFIATGDRLILELREAQAHMGSAGSALPPALAEHCSQKGKLYDRIWRLVQIGQVEFLHEPDQAAAFNFSILNRALRAGSELQSGKPVIA